MTDFRKRFLFLAVATMAFAGASYGQLVSCTSIGVPVVPGPTSMRAEGTTELTGDQVFNCVNGASTTLGVVTAFESAPVTSQLLNPQPSGQTVATEAALVICPALTTVSTATISPCTTATTGSTGPFYGTVSGNSVTFSSVILPTGNFTGRVSNIRVNASSVTIASTLTTETGTILVSATGTSAATLATTLGFIFKSLVTPAFVLNPNGPNTATLTTYTACGGNALSASTPLTKVSFAISVAESFAGAFKTGNGSAISGGEGGSFIPGTNNAGTAISGTKIQLVFANVANAVTLYVPTSVSNGGLTLTLVATANSADPVTPLTASTTTGAPAGTAALTTASGGAAAYYEVTASNAGLVQSVNVPVFVTFAANAFTTVPAAITVLESYAPSASAATATTVPNFAPSTNTPLPATAITLCSTSLLFPFITNVSGFDTGIALSNTSVDPFGSSSGPGACTLNFYGTGTPTPSTGVAAPGGTQAGGSSSAFLLSAVAPGFTGYMIAQCSYNLGHGFAYVIYNFAQNNGSTMGYLPLVLNRTTGSASESLGE